VGELKLDLDVHTMLRGSLPGPEVVGRPSWSEKRSQDGWPKIDMSTSVRKI
jgi:hypothetical protein